MQVHVIRCGRLRSNRTFMRGSSWSSLLRRREDFEFPIHAFVLEHPEGRIAIDTGFDARIHTPRIQRRMVPVLLSDASEEMAPQMQAQGLEPADVRRVVLTHLDWDHAGGLRHFPDAEVLVHRPDWEFAATRPGRMRFHPELWPQALSPTVYDLDPEPYGPFPQSRAVTADGRVRVVPLPGHSLGQVGVVAELDDSRLLFCADHILRVDWFEEDYAAGRLLGLGIFYRDLAVETSRRLHAFSQEPGAVLVASHDSETPARVAAATPAKAAPQTRSA